MGGHDSLTTSTPYTKVPYMHTHSIRGKRINTTTLVLVGILVVLAAMAFSVAAKAYATSACVNRGGQAITSPWLSENAWEVRCIEPTN